MPTRQEDSRLDSNKQETSAAAQVARGLHVFGFVVLVTIAAARPLVVETYASSQTSIDRALTAIGDPSPIRTLVFDLVIMIVGLLWLTGRALAPDQPYRRSGLERGGVILAIAALLSCLAAGNQRLAINASIDWLSLLVLGILLVQLTQRTWQRNLLVMAIVATTFTQATVCLEQHFISHADTREQYFEEGFREEFWASQGVPLDDPQVDLFERRLNAQETSGTLPHPNVAASALLLGLFPAVALALLGLRSLVGRSSPSRNRKPIRADSDVHGDRDKNAVGRDNVTRQRGNEARSNIGAILCAVMAGMIAVAVFTTGSLGAMASVILVVVLGAIAWLKRDWISRHRRRVFVWAWIAVLVGIGGVIGHGLYHKSLPGMSLTFRWQYWTASAKMFVDYATTGVGRENFGSHYLQYKAIDSPEEISTPHNLLVQAATEWGIIGLIGFAFLLFDGSRKLVPGRARLDPPEPVPQPVASATTPTEVMAGLLIAPAVVMLRVGLLGVDDAAMKYYVTVLTAIAWCLGFLVTSMPLAAQRAGRFVRVAAGSSLFAFVLQDMINFAFFVPATATMAFAVFALARVSEADDADSATASQTRSARRWIAPAVGAVVVASFIGWVLVPQARAYAALMEAREALLIQNIGVEQQPAFTAFDRAARLDPLDPTPAKEKAVWLVQVSQVLPPKVAEAALRDSIKSVHEAIERDPHRKGLYSLLSQVYARLADRTIDRDDYHSAIAAAERAVLLYPRSPSDRIAWGDRLLAAGEGLSDAALLQQAALRYGQALTLDKARDWETIRRLPARVVEEVQAKIARAKRLTEPRP